MSQYIVRLGFWWSGCDVSLKQYAKLDAFLEQLPLNKIKLKQFTLASYRHSMENSETELNSSKKCNCKDKKNSAESSTVQEKNLGSKKSQHTRNTSH